MLSALGSMPIGMFGLAILLLARETTGSFASAGRVVGAFGLANAFGAVAQGRLMDRLGQARVLRAAAVVHALALIALVLAAEAGATHARAGRRGGGRRASPPPAPGRDALAVGHARATTRSSARPPTRWSRSCSRWR